ncbi:hypothetical protein VP01_1089g8 [Puccinia sorghi]|uniref:Uncharacterized protein n=1 Tax=Puccinia sorghi TaxID=27349 RepID=A0A0L6VT61_9BASI|nr:hypothetical protein VP01_1089g8 [Puccinia sorghi]
MSDFEIKVFLVLKSKLKCHHILTGTSENPQLINKFLPSFVSPDLMSLLFIGSGYSEGNALGSDFFISSHLCVKVV